MAVPYGTIARLLLIWLQSEAVEKGSRDIQVGQNPAQLLEKLGLSRGGPISRKVAAQLEQICACSMDYRIGNDKRALIINERIVESYEYVAVEDSRTKRSSRMVCRLRLSEAFYRELSRHPILVDRGAIRTIQTSPRAIDIYLWLAYRLHALKESTPVSYSALWRQFGRERLFRTFKSEFQEPLALALSVYPGAEVQRGDKGLVLVPSPPPISRP